MAFSVGKIGGNVVQFFSTLSNMRAVEAQAKANGGAMNTAAQSSVQSQQDRLRNKEQARLLGHPLLVEATHAPEPAHTATGEDDHSPAERRDWSLLRRRRGGSGRHQQGQSHDPHGEDEAKAPDFYATGEHGK